MLYFFLTIILAVNGFYEKGHFDYDKSDFRSEFALGLSTVKHLDTINIVKKLYHDCDSIRSDPYDSSCLVKIFNDDYFWL